MSETVIFSKSSVERKGEYRQLTLIMTDGARKWVRKRPVGRAAVGHMHEYAANLEALNASLRPGSAVEMISCRENADGSVDFPFLTDPTLGKRLTGLGAEEYIRAVKAFEDALTAGFETCPFDPGEDPADSSMEIGFIERKNHIRSALGERYIEEMKRYLEAENPVNATAGKAGQSLEVK